MHWPNEQSHTKTDQQKKNPHIWHNTLTHYFPWCKQDRSAVAFDGVKIAFSLKIITMVKGVLCHALASLSNSAVQGKQHLHSIRRPEICHCFPSILLKHRHRHTDTHTHTHTHTHSHWSDAQTLKRRTDIGATHRRQTTFSYKLRSTSLKTIVERLSSSHTFGFYYIWLKTQIASGFNYVCLKTQIACEVM